MTLFLLVGQTEQSVEDQEKAKKMKSEIVSHWHPNITVNLGREFSFLFYSVLFGWSAFAP